jgi:hypothetical protein
MPQCRLIAGAEIVGAETVGAKIVGAETPDNRYLPTPRTASTQSLGFTLIARSKLGIRQIGYALREFRATLGP